jgi:hypothetical protein
MNRLSSLALALALAAGCAETQKPGADVPQVSALDPRCVTTPPKGGKENGWVNNPGLAKSLARVAANCTKQTQQAEIALDGATGVCNRGPAEGSQSCIDQALDDFARSMNAAIIPAKQSGRNILKSYQFEGQRLWD